MFTDVFIRRPIFATTVSLIVLLVGLISLMNLTIRQFPYVEISAVTITTTYPGANADLMEGFITTPLENAISTVDGIDYISSTNVEGKSTITVQMQIGYDIDNALTEITAQVSSVRWKLPKNINDPIINKQDPNAQPIIYLSFSSEQLSPEAVTDYLLRVVQPQIQMQGGVNQALIYGQREYAMRVWLNPHRMAAFNVTANDINDAINQQNVQATSGRLKDSLQEYDVYSTTDLQNAKQFNNLVIRKDKNYLVRIKDIGQAKLGAVNDRVAVNMNGKSTIVMGVIPTSTANPLAVAKEVKKMLPEIQKYAPKDMKVGVLWDASKFITASLNEVFHTVIEACIFVFLVIFLMLGSFRAVFVPIVTIPLSIIGVCAIMLALHYSINLMTLLAFVLAIGLVVDDAIVVLENIHRHLAEGKTPFQAAIIGAREISFAIIAMTLTLAAVYTPVGFMTGLTGQLFTEFAFTLAGAVLVSGFLALTLSPMMCSKLYKANENLNKGFPGIVNRIFDKLTHGYKFLLKWVIKARYFVLVLALVVYGSCYFLYVNTPSEMVPQEDQGAVMGIGIGPAAANINYTEQQGLLVGKIYSSIPEATDYAIISGYPYDVSSFISFVVLKPWDQRKRTAMQIMQQLYQEFWTVPGMKVYPSMPPLLPGASGFTPISFVLKTTKSYDYLKEVSDKFEAELIKWGGLQNIDNDLKIDKPQAVVDIQRSKAGDLGVPMFRIAQSLSVFLGEPITTWFDMQGRSYEVIPQVFQPFRATPDTLHDLNVRTQSNELVPLSNLVKVKERDMPRSLNHYQQLRSATITANLAPHITQGDALTYMTNLANKTLPKDIMIDYADQSRQYIQATGKMIATFIFAIIFIYLILAAQFESFRDPFIVMLSVPLSIAGALALLMLGHGTMNIYTQIGLVTLVGLITKNGILIVEFANQQQEKGLPFKEALIEGASLRLRPILMTTFCMILGAIPLAMASGASAVSRQQMGLVIIGGMSFGTLLTLFVVPVAYYLFATKIEPNTKMWKELEEIDQLSKKK